MGFEDFKADWNARKFEGYLFENPPAVIAGDVRRSAEKRLKRHQRREKVDYGFIAVVVIVSLILVSLETSLLARVGTILCMVALLIEVLSVIKLQRLDAYGGRDDLQYKSSLLEDRRCVVARIRLLKWKTSWYALPLLLGSASICISQGWDVNTVLGFSTGILIGVVLAHFACLIHIRRHLIPALQKIDREIKRLDEIPE